MRSWIPRSWIPRIAIYSLLGVAVICGAFADQISGVWLARKLRVHAEREPDIDRAISSVKRLALIDGKGWLQLVNLLEAPAERVWVADEARRQLTGKVESWRKLPPEESAAKIQSLAARLRTASEDWGDDTTLFVGRMAQTLLTWPIPANERSHNLVADCEYLIHRAASVSPVDSEESSEGVDPAESESLADATVGVPAPVRGAVGDQVSPLGSGNPTSIGNQGGARDVDSRFATKRSPIGGTAKIAPSYTIDDEGYRIDRPSDGRAGRSTSSEQHVVIGTGKTIPIAADGLSSDPFRLQQDGEIIRKLASYRVEEVLGAAKELRRRGYSDAELNVAEDAVDPDVYVRRGLVERLSFIPNVDTKRWLLWMARDEDLDTRRQAVMMLASMINSDPHIAIQLRRIQVEEDDPWIRKRLSTVLR